MPSFFTLPASQKKRKRQENDKTGGTKRARPARDSSKAGGRQPRPERDESISGSDSEDEDTNLNGEEAYSSDDDDERETAAEKRLRLAEQYLENVRGEVQQVGFDAADIDRDLIAERLKEDVAETKGRVYRYVADELDFSAQERFQFRADTKPTTSIAVCPPYAYTVTKGVEILKWKLSEPLYTIPPPKRKSQPKPTSRRQPPPKKRPELVLKTKGLPAKRFDSSYQHHTAPILCIKASQDGKFVVTGGADKKIIVWNAEDLTPLRVFTQHRSAVTGLAFRRGTNQLYSSSADRTIKCWSLNELAYLETLFGHQDEVLDVAALSQERCVSVGARDRTVRLWKVIEETNLIFRGSGGGETDLSSKKRSKSRGDEHVEGSIDRVAMIDEEMFVTGSDNGSISLWSLQKKKPVFIVHLAHGIDPAPPVDESYAEHEVEGRESASRPMPRWITALATVPYSDLIISGSWDGCIRLWKLSQDKRRLDSVGYIGQAIDPGSEALVLNGGPDHDLLPRVNGVNGTSHINGLRTNNDEYQQSIRGIINDIAVFERGHRGKAGLCIVAAVGKEHRLGKWKRVDGKNDAVVIEIPKRAVVPNGTSD